MKEQFPNPGQLTLCYMDTDSFFYHIKTEDYYADMKPMIHSVYPPGDIRIFDTSNYDPENIYKYKLLNKKVLGAMKDETAGEPIKEFLGLRAKTYIYDVENKGTSRRAKGIKRKVAEELTMDDYKQCVDNREIKIRKKMVLFKSFKHQIYTQRIEKCALNGADDKRYIRKDNISTYAYGHKALKLE